MNKCNKQTFFNLLSKQNNNIFMHLNPNLISDMLESPSMLLTNDQSSELQSKYNPQYLLMGR